jgi:cob(I)alamin adenosyltransferase
MGLFYTGAGDKGKSPVWDNKKLDKTSPGLTALGDLDELNSLLGLIRSQKIPADYKNILSGLQESLFTVQAIVYLYIIKRKEKASPFDEEKTNKLESLINALEKYVNPERGFVVSGDGPVGAWLDFARAVSRRAERSVWILNKKVKLPPGILSYLNRFSSLLFALARASAKKAKKKKRHPKYK